MLSETEIHAIDHEVSLLPYKKAAVIEALKLLKTKCDIQIYTDSKYVMDGITNWIIGWKARGWKTADKKPVKNVDLWQQLDTCCRAKHFMELG